MRQIRSKPLALMGAGLLLLGALPAVAQSPAATDPWTAPYDVAAAKTEAAATGTTGRSKPAVPPANRDIFYAEEVYAALGLDRLKRPDNALQRLTDRGDLHGRKINGRLVFKKADVERLKENGSRRSRRGRPPGARNKVPAGS